MSDRITFRLNNERELFEKELKKAEQDNPKLTPSKFIRFCIRTALTEQNAMNPEQANHVLTGLNNLKKELSKIGGNMNQIAHYFNIHDHLIESDLKQQHLTIKDQLKEVNNLLSEVQNGIRRSIY